MSAPAATRSRLLLVAELTLLAVTGAAVLGLGGLFLDGSFVPDVLATAVLAHLLAAACRRRGLGAGTTALVALVGAVFVISLLHAPGTTFLGLPTTETLRQVRLELDDAWRTFGESVAPAPVLPGFVLAASVGVWFVAFAADSAAFRAGASVEAVVPASTVFVFGSALGRGEHRVLIAGLFLAAVLTHWLAQRARASTSAPTWLASERGDGTGAGSLLRAGALLGGLGVVAAVVVGPNLPGADARSVIPWRATDRDEPDARVTISPLVDIRSRLVDQADVEVFRVRTDQRSYWRLTSLERFDGRIWSSNRQYRPADGRLGTEVDVTAGRADLVRQEFTIGALSSIWLPAAFRPVELDGLDARYDPDSNSLLTESDTATGLRYTVESALPRLEAADLAGVPAVAPTAVRDVYTLLPPEFSPRVRQLAAELTRGASSQYEKALALQDHLRGDAFTYDLEVQPGHSGDDLEQFLFVSRRGYCEQFAGAFAAMARAAGLPSRVAVGFTPGEPDPATGDFVVHGYNGHAWPEVYLQGYGWVAFEPTPGRGVPGGESYTNVPEQQAVSGDPETATTLPPAPAPDAPAPEAPAPAPARDPDAPAVAPAAEPSPWPGRLLVAAAVALLVPLLWAAVLAALRALRRRRRRAAAATPAARVLVAWDEVAEALARSGAGPEPWETPAEFAGRAGGAGGVDRGLLGGLADLTTTASYGPVDLPEQAAEEATGAAGRLEREAEALLGRRDRLRFLLDPRPLLPERAARVDVREAVPR